MLGSLRGPRAYTVFFERASQRIHSSRRSISAAHDHDDDFAAAHSKAPKPAIDTKHIRDNAQLYSENCVNRNYRSQALAPYRLRDAHTAWQKLQEDVRPLRERNNTLRTKLMTSATAQEITGEGKNAHVLQEAREIKEKLKTVTLEEERLQAEIQNIAFRIPNVTSEETPVGENPRLIGYINDHPESSGVQHRTWRSHIEVGERLQLIDWKAARTSSGTGWYFLIGEAALMEQALIQYALRVAMRRGWKIVAPPSIVYSHIVSACGFLPRDQNGEQQIYALTQPAKDRSKPEYSLAGTAEIPLAAMKANMTLNEEELPLKVIGVSRCYRAEAGARGVQSKGLYRVHEFTKVEMFAWTIRDEESPARATTDSGASTAILCEMVDIQTEILRSLNLHCRILEMPSHDLGASASRKQDIEAWFPSRRELDNGWGEVTSASICTDYQSRRLATRLKTTGQEKKSWPFTVNGTAMAIPRVLAAILENGWDETREVVHIPEVLRPYMGGLEVIGKQ